MAFQVSGSIPISFAWSDLPTAIAMDLKDDEVKSLTADGWTILDPQADDLAAQVGALTGGH